MMKIAMEFAVYFIPCKVKCCSLEKCTKVPLKHFKNLTCFSKCENGTAEFDGILDFVYYLIQKGCLSAWAVNGEQRLYDRREL